MTEDLPQEIKTDRLLLRRWRESDGPLFAQMNADPKVMECFPSLLTREESDESMRRICEHFDEHGFGLWAVEVPGTAEFIGYVGLKYPTWQAWFTPCVEVGWRIDSRYWGNGYAPEAAKASLEFAFHAAGLKEIYSFTVPHNLRSRRVMEKIGMTHMQEHDFAHPIPAPDHPLSRHVLYRISRSDFARS